MPSSCQRKWPVELTVKEMSRLRVVEGVLGVME